MVPPVFDRMIRMIKTKYLTICYSKKFFNIVAQYCATCTVHVQDILKKINGDGYSEFYLMERNFTALLSGIQRDSNDEIVSATGTVSSRSHLPCVAAVWQVMRWMGRMNATKALLEGAADDAGTSGEVNLAMRTILPTLTMYSWWTTRPTSLNTSWRRCCWPPSPPPRTTLGWRSTWPTVSAASLQAS